MYYHIVFSTKSRNTYIKSKIKNRLYQYINGIIENNEGKTLAIGGTDDHLHILLSINGKIELMNLIRDIKANSSKWANETLELDYQFGWQNGYAAFTVSYSNLEQVRNYIENQEEHHKHSDFKNEFILLLQKHNIAFDEKYIFV